MIGILSKSQCETVLQTEVLGRIGCYDGKQVYVVPVTYVFSDGFIYAHSKEGLKIRIMRKNPKVCFQVDHIENMRHWRSVIAQGVFEELKTPERQTVAMKILFDRLSPIQTSESVKPINHSLEDKIIIERELKAIIYRISVKEITGRFEKGD